MSISDEDKGQKPIHIALFKCDTPMPAVVATDGDYTVIFNKLLRDSLPHNAGKDFVLDPYDVRNSQQYPENIDDYQAILLTGSAASAYENSEWVNRLIEYVRDVALNKPQVKLIGICFGHQIIARALGGECVPNQGRWEVGIYEVDLTAIGKQLLGISTLNIQQMHRDHVPSVPGSFELLGYTTITPNQGMVKFYPNRKRPGESALLEDVHIFTVQGHPEFTERIVDKMVAARESTGIISKDVADGARQRAKWRNDGVSVVGQAIWRILGVANA